MISFVLDQKVRIVPFSLPPPLLLPLAPSYGQVMGQSDTAAELVTSPKTLKIHSCQNWILTSQRVFETGICQSEAVETLTNLINTQITAFNLRLQCQLLTENNTIAST